MPNIEMDLVNYIIRVGLTDYPIVQGHLKTTHAENGVLWDWQVDLSLNKFEVIPLNEKLKLCYPNGDTVCFIEVLKRSKNGQYTHFEIVPRAEENEFSRMI